MPKPALEVDGLRELRRGLRSIDKGLGPQLRKVDKQVSQAVVDESKPDIPVDTGKLKASARAVGDTGVMGGAKAPYVDFIYWQSMNKWYHTEAERLANNGQLEKIYLAGLQDMLTAAGLDYQ
jgi:hypothetical protein